jgi:hypothetical protein
MIPAQPSTSVFRRRISVLAAVAVAAATFSGTPARAYVYEPGSPRWSPGTVTFVLSLGPSNRTLIDGSTSWDAAAAPALAVWNQYMQSLRLNGVSDDSAPVSNNDGVNSIAFASTFFGSSFGSNTLAITGYYTSGGRLSEANILVNNRQSWDSYRGALRFNSGWDIQRVLIHELGHALGLDHPDQHGQNVNAVMNSIVSDADTAMADDINGIQSIYGSANNGGTNPAPTPVPTPQPPPSNPPPQGPTTATLSVADTMLHPGETTTFTVSLSSPAPYDLTINYISTGSARANLYWLSGTPRHVTIPAGSSTGDIALTANSAPRRGKTVTLSLVNGAGYSVSFPRSASIVISR